MDLNLHATQMPSQLTNGQHNRVRDSFLYNTLFVVHQQINIRAVADMPSFLLWRTLLWLILDKQQNAGNE